MSDVIGLLERLGSDARLRHADRQEIEVALQASGLNSALQSAIVEGDHQRLGQLLCANANTCCLIEPVEVESVS